MTSFSILQKISVLAKILLWAKYKFQNNNLKINHKTFETNIIINVKCMAELHPENELL